VISRTINSIIFIVVCTLSAILAYHSASACQVDEFYLTKDGALAASTPENLNAAVKFEEEGNRENLSGLMKSGAAQRLTDNIKVQVLERSVEFKMLKIKLPDGKEAYWVKDGSLKQISCN
jgi:hypothetical protein